MTGNSIPEPLAIEVSISLSGADSIPQAGTALTVRAPPIFVDWARTKLLAVEGGNGVEKVRLEDLAGKYPPPRALYVDGAPMMTKDAWVDLGYEVFYANTQVQQKLRLENALAKSDTQDASLMLKFQDEIAWHRHIRTEPEIVKLLGLLGYREFQVKNSKLAAQYLAAPMYKDSRLIDSSKRPREGVLELDSELGRLCRELALHQFHSRIYGVGCLTALTAISKRPWVFQHGVGGWRKAMGCTQAARPDYPTKHSLGCDVTLKSLIYGASATLIGKKSPWRPLYEEQKARLPLKLLKGKAGRGTFKVTSHKRAMNRVITRVVVELYGVGMEWAKSRGFQSHDPSSTVDAESSPSAGGS